MPRVCGEIRSLEEKSLPSGRDLHEMGVQMVSDARAWDSMVFSLLLWPNDMSGATKVTWNSLQNRKAFSIWPWWHVLWTTRFLGCRSGLFSLIKQQPLPIRIKRGPFSDENPDFGLKTLQMRERQKKQKKQGEKGSFLGENTKNRLPALIFQAQISNMIWISLFPIGFEVSNGFWLKKGPSHPLGRELYSLPDGRDFISLPTGRELYSLLSGREL